MRLFKKDEKALQQDLSEVQKPGTVFMMSLLMEEMCPMPSRDKMDEVMRKHFGETECFSHDEKMSGYAIKKYSSQFKDVAVPPQLIVMGCISTDDFKLDAITLSQMWDCPESEEILSKCKYQVCATDMLAAALDYKDRADMDMDFMEALMELFPECKAVFFQNSGKMFTRESIIDHTIPQDKRFTYFAVNVRFFNIQGTNDMMVDTLGMSALFMPDLQYHFHDIDPNEVVNHAYNMLSYIYDSDCPIKSGDTIDGIKDGVIDINVQWPCQYENALIQPAREVIDICMGEYASGDRN